MRSELRRRLEQLEKRTRPQPEVDEEMNSLLRAQRFLYLKRLERLDPGEPDPGPPPVEWIRQRWAERRQRGEE